MISQLSQLTTTLGALLLILGSLLFLLGSIGLLRFNSLYARLHALTKVDSLGLGLVVLGTWLLSPSWQLGWKLLAIWLLVMLASAASGYLLANLKREEESC